MPKVFISHSTKDRTFVEREIIPLLESHGIGTWYAKDDIRTADRWERSILSGLKACDWFMVIMSPRSAASEWVKQEIDWAFSKRKSRIIPVLFEECESEEFHFGLVGVQHVDFVRDKEEGRERLLSLWGIASTPTAKSEPLASSSTVEELDLSGDDLADENVLVIAEDDETGGVEADDRENEEGLKAYVVHVHPAKGILADLTLTTEVAENGVNVLFRLKDRPVTLKSVRLKNFSVNQSEPARYFSLAKLKLGIESWEEDHPLVLRVYNCAKIRQPFLPENNTLAGIDLVSSPFGVASKQSVGFMVNDVFKPVIQAGEPLPCTKKITLKTTMDNQKAIKIIPAVADGQIRLPELKVRGLLPLPARSAWVDCTFRVDHDGRLTVMSRSPLTPVREILMTRSTVNSVE